MLFTSRYYGVLGRSGITGVARVALFAIVLLCWTTLVSAETKARSKAAPRRTPRTPAQFAAGSERSARSYVPAHQRTSDTSVRVLQEQGAKKQTAEKNDPVPEDVTEQPEMLFEEQHMGMEPMMGEITGDCGCEGPCGHQQGCLIPCPTNCWHNIELFAGAHGFTGPLNRGETGSFGFDEGLNWGAPVPCLCTGELGMQAGMRATHSNFSGAEFSNDERTQIFATAGLFRRVDWGFQGGVVMDYLHEDWYLETDLSQIRGELSWKYPCRHEIGFWFTASTQTETVVSRTISGTTTVTANEELEPTDLYAFFYRHRIDNAGIANGRVFAGFTGESDGLLGADVNVPLNDCWAFQSGFTYLVPEETSHVEESWNFALGVIWRPGGGLMCGQNYYRPLFDVASNGNFMVDRD